MEQIAIDGLASTTVIGWVRIIKDLIPDTWVRLLPLFAIVLGEIYAFSLRSGCASIAQCVFVGLVIGLSAAGAYSGAKNLVERRPAPAAPPSPAP